MLENAQTPSPIDRQPIASRARNQRSKITNRPTKMAIDGRTPLGRRLRDIADQLADVLAAGQSSTSCRRVRYVRRPSLLRSLKMRGRASSTARLM